MQMGEAEHINRLELRSILLALRWRVQRLGECQCRFIHLTDSYVSMSVVSKGRSSSEALMSVMRQIAALQLGFQLYPILIHVESTDNPTDDASRAWHLPWDDCLVLLVCAPAVQDRRPGVTLCWGDAGISKKTQERYYNSVSLLCKEVVHVTSMEDMDDQISDWIEAQFHKGAPLNVVADALSGMHYFLPTTRRRLPGSWKLFSNWRKMEIPI